MLTTLNWKTERRNGREYRDNARGKMCKKNTPAKRQNEICTPGAHLQSESLLAQEEDLATLRLAWRKNFGRRMSSVK